MTAAAKTEVIQANSISRASLVTRMASKYGVQPEKMLATLKATAFHSKQEISNEQMMALLVVADQYGLNPWTKEIYAFPDEKRGGIVPVLGVDGWARIINENPNFDGMNFSYGPSDPAKWKGAPAWIECTMYRKDRPQHPCTVRESLLECYRDTGPWQSHPARMLRHKTMIQCARLAFGFVGVYDPDEAERIIEGTATTVAADPTIEGINNEIQGKAGSTPAQSQRSGETGGGFESRDEAQEAKGAAGPAVKAAAKSVVGAPTYAEIMDLLRKAEKNRDRDAVAQAKDLMRSIEDEGQRAELDVELRRVSKALAEAEAADRR